MRILALAYACDPRGGSEGGAGWLWARTLARIGEVVVVTHPIAREEIEAERVRLPAEERFHAVYVPLPRVVDFDDWRHAGVRARYLAWQLLALREARRLHRAAPFDVAWHVTFANVWLGSVGGLIGPPFVLGPVGGGPRTPARLLPTLGVRGVARDLARTGAQTAARYANPFARLAWRRASVVLAQNAATRDWLPRRHRGKVEIFPHAGVDELPSPAGRTAGRPPTALYAGRLLPWKGVALAIDALALLPGWRLLVCGAGPDADRLAALARRRGVQARVEFLPWQERDELARVMSSEADVLLFPSLHDDSPLTVVEALARGLPVVCVDVGGPPLLAGPAGVAVAPGSRRQVARSLACATAELARRDGAAGAVARRRAAEFLPAARAAAVAAVAERARAGAESTDAAPKRVVAR